MIFRFEKRWGWEVSANGRAWIAIPFRPSDYLGGATEPKRPRRKYERPDPEVDRG